jgi:hypothetical protein
MLSEHERRQLADIEARLTAEGLALLPARMARRRLCPEFGRVTDGGRCC